MFDNYLISDDAAVSITLTEQSKAVRLSLEVFAIPAPFLVHESYRRIESRA
jgi:hypothetical protein